MGGKTYEFGYKFGLQSGQPAYPLIRHYIFSSSLHFNKAASNMNICSIDFGNIKNLKTMRGTDIYLCGGGEFAGWLLEKMK